MWHQYLDNVKFLHTLYREIPLLTKVNITNLLITDAGNRVKLVFEMTQYPDYPPKKWKGSNVVSVEIDFIGISNLDIHSIGHNYSGNIEITKCSNGLMEVLIQGKLELKMLAEIGYVQQINAYLVNN